MKSRLITLITAGLLLCLWNNPDAFSSEKAGTSGEKYVFSNDWFTHNIPNWTRVLSDMKGKPGLTYLEVGVFEGRSFFWVLDNILTHPSSKAIAIDTFNLEDYTKRFFDNMDHSGHSSKIQVLKGLSQQKLRDLNLNSIDLIYVDGDHKSKAVLQDLILVWDLLKDGGILMIDDYKMFFGLPMENRPEFSVDVFKILFKDEFQILIDDYQLIVRKSRTSCDETKGQVWGHLVCSRLGPYVFYWNPRKLYDALTNKEIPLNEEEISLVENTLRNLKLGLRVEVGKTETDLYKQFLMKLGLHEISVSPKGK